MLDSVWKSIICWEGSGAGDFSLEGWGGDGGGEKEKEEMGRLMGMRLRLMMVRKMKDDDEVRGEDL
jgi:hypothetical protein